MSAAASDPEAQRWLGWPSQALIPESQRARLLATEPGQGRAQPGHIDYSLLAVHRASGLAAGGAGLYVGTQEVGGWLAPDFRARGLGAELFAAIARFGHDHIGLPSVRAGTEPTNVACVAALLAAGFEPAQGPETHQLPDGRTAPASWFRHDSEHSARCRG
jgi:RimJ/RimL family protein N-acetyltransferase